MIKYVTILVLFIASTSASNAAFAGEIGPEGYEKGKNQCVDSVLDLKKVLEDSAGNWREIAEALERSASGELKYLSRMLGKLTPLELLETDSATLLEHVKCALDTRKNLQWKVKDDDFVEYVLNPHLKYIALRPWRKKLGKYFAPFRAATIRETALAINEWTGRNLSLFEEKLGNNFWPKTPLAVLKSGSGTERELAAFLTASMRSLGIPSRMHEKGWVEFLDGDQWLPAYPLEPDNFASKNMDPETSREYAEPGRLKVTFKRNGLPVKGFQDFSVQDVSKRGYFESRAIDQDASDEKGVVDVELPPGSYRLFAGVRNARGEPLVQHYKIDIKSGQTVEREISLDLPVDEWKPKDFIARDLVKIPEKGLVDQEGKAVNMKDAVKQNRAALVVFYDYKSEPPQRMVPRLREFAKSREMKSFFVYVGKPTEKEKVILGEKDASAETLAITAENAEKLFNVPRDKDSGHAENIPHVLLFVDGKLAVWQEGYNMSIVKVLEKALGKD